MYKYQHKPVTIVARTEGNKTYFGVTKFGGTKREKFISELGFSIAEHRTEIQPFTVIDRQVDEQEFEAIALAITGHVLRAKQWTPNLPRTK